MSDIILIIMIGLLIMELPIIIELNRKERNKPGK